jgi:RNase P subunit RPR2
MGKRMVMNIARERIDILLRLALETAESDLSRAESYAKLAWRIAEKYNLRRKTVLRRYFRCSKCKSPVIPGRSLKIRVLKDKGVGLICLKCGSVKLIPVFREKDKNTGVEAYSTRFESRAYG